MTPSFVVVVVSAFGLAVNVAAYVDPRDGWWNLAGAIFCGALVLHGFLLEPRR